MLCVLWFVSVDLVFGLFILFGFVGRFGSSSLSWLFRVLRWCWFAVCWLLTFWFVFGCLCDCVVFAFTSVLFAASLFVDFC